MPLSWNEIRDRAHAFARDWRDAKSERADSQSFWNEFFEVFGVSRRRVADLVRAHQALDRAVDVAYGRKDFKSDAERVGFLFELYQQYTSLLPAAKTEKPRKPCAKPPAASRNA